MVRCVVSTDLEFAARLTAALLCAPRFAGRAEAQQYAVGGIEPGLRLLELAAAGLHEEAAGAISYHGVGSVAVRQVEAKVAGAFARGVAALCGTRAGRARQREAPVRRVPPEPVALVRRLEQLPASARLADVPLEVRAPGWLAPLLALRAAREAYREAGFRSAKHSHSATFVLGEPWARSESGSATARSVGLGRSYQRKAGWVATSAHYVTVDESILRVPRARRAGAGWMLLAPGVRVRQGRGTALVADAKKAIACSLTTTADPCKQGIP